MALLYRELVNEEVEIGGTKKKISDLTLAELEQNSDLDLNEILGGFPAYESAMERALNSALKKIGKLKDEGRLDRRMAEALKPLWDSFFKAKEGAFTLKELGEVGLDFESGMEIWPITKDSGIDDWSMSLALNSSTFSLPVLARTVLPKVRESACVFRVEGMLQASENQAAEQNRDGTSATPD